jgi:MFS family permease
MSTLEGDWSEEKSEWLKSEQRRLHELESQKSDIYAQYLAGELSLEEYRNRIGAATDAELVLEVFDVVLEQDAYLRQQAQQGESAVYLYDTGWRLLLNEREDYVLTAIIILLFAGLYADEYSLRTVPLLRATKKGRRQLFLSKLGMASMLSGGVQLFLLLGRVNVLRTNYHLPQPHATASSMAEFGATNSSILGMVVSVMLMRWFSILLLTLLTVSISACFRNTIAATLFTAISIYLSPLLSLLGVSTLETFTLNNTLAATPLLLDGTSRTAAIVMLGVTFTLALLAAWRERCFET